MNKCRRLALFKLTLVLVILLIISSFQPAISSEIIWSLNGLPFTQIKSISIDYPDDIIYVGTNRGLFRTLNFGKKWLLSNDIQIDTQVVAVDPNNHKTIFTGTVKGLYKSVDDGMNWTLLKSASTSKVLINRANSNVVYALMQEALFKSADGGKNWTAMGNAAISGITCLALDPKDTEVIYAGTSGGLLKSNNGGTNWSNLSNSSVNSIAIDPSDHNILYIGTSGGVVYKTADGGVNWSSSSGGLSQAEINTLFIDPANHKVILAGTQSGLFRSANGGDIWTNESGGLYDSYVYSLVKDLETHTFYAGTKSGIFEFTSLDPPREVSLKPSEKALLTMPSGNLKIAIPTGTYTTPIKMTINQKSVSSVTSQGLAALMGYDFSIKSVTTGSKVSVLKKDVVLNFNYNEAMLKKNQAPENKLWIFNFGKVKSRHLKDKRVTTSKWIPVKNTVFNKKKNIVLCRVRHFSQYALMADTGKPTILLLSPNVIGTKIKVAPIAKDNGTGIGSEWFYLDGIIRFKDIRAPYQWVFDAKKLKGQHSLKVVVFDKVKNSAQQTVKFRVYQ